MCLGFKALKMWCCKGAEERECICKGYFSQYRHGNASGMPSDYGPWSSWYFTSIFNASFLSNYSMEQVKEVVPGSEHALLYEDTLNDPNYLMQFSQNRTRVPREEEDGSSFWKPGGGHSIRKRNNQMVLMVHKWGRKRMTHKCQVVARGGPQRLVRAVETA